MIRPLRNILQRRELLWVLILKEFSATYRQSLLGVAWALIQPLGVTFLGILLRVVFMRSGSLGEDVLFIFAASLPWALFSNSVIMGTASVVRNASILKKVYFPREIFIISTIATRMIDFLIAGCGLVAIMIIVGAKPTIWLLWIPAFLVVELALAVGICLFTAAAAVYKRDVMYGMPFIMMFWMFCSPVFYEVGDVPERFRNLYMLNPMAGIITAFRQVIVYGGAPGVESMLHASVLSIAVLVTGFVLFKKLEMRFADVI